VVPRARSLFPTPLQQQQPPQRVVDVLVAMGLRGLRLAAWLLLEQLVEDSARGPARAWPLERRILRMQLQCLAQAALQRAQPAPPRRTGAAPALDARAPVVDTLAVIEATAFVARSSARRTDRYVLPRSDDEFVRGMREAQRRLAAGDPDAAAAELLRLPQQPLGPGAAMLMALLEPGAQLDSDED
jgi:hypothetical protein